jgi:hypothetical protein
MGFLDRAGKIFEGAMAPISAPAGFLIDLVKAPIVEDDVDGFLNTIKTAAARNSQQGANAALGPEGPIGSAVGVVPEEKRSDFKRGMAIVNRGLETAYDYSVDRPGSTFLTMMGRARADEEGMHAGRLFKGDNWRDAWKESKGVSFGQSAMYYDLDDFEDEEERRRLEETTHFKFFSGAFDATSRVFLDPTVVVGKAVKVARAGQFAKNVLTGERIWVKNDVTSPAARNQLVNSTVFRKTFENMKDKSATELRDTYFKGNEQGAVISALLADTRKGDSAKHFDRFKTVNLALMGDLDAKAMLAKESVWLNNAVERAVDNRDIVIGRKDAFAFANSASRKADSDKELAELWDDDIVGAAARLDDDVLKAESQIDKAQKLENSRAGIVGMAADPAYIPLTSVPTHSGFQKYKASIIEDAKTETGTIFQRNPLSAVLRTATTMRPGGRTGLIALHDPGTDRELSRFLEASDVPRETSVMLREKYMRAVTEMDRSNIWEETEAAAIRAAGEKHGLDVDEVEALLRTAQQGRRETNQIANVSGRSYDGEGKDRLDWVDPDTGHRVSTPLFNTQNVNYHVAQDIFALNKAFTKLGKFKAEHPNLSLVQDAPSQVLDTYNRIWKPATLLRLGWPLRVVTDEQMRIVAKIGVLAQLDNIKIAMSNAKDDVIARTPRAERLPGLRDFEYKGNAVPNAFARPDGQVGPNVFIDKAKAQGAPDALVGLKSAAQANAVRTEALVGEKSGQWRTIRADDPDATIRASYGGAWEHAVNKQIAGDPMGKMLLNGMSTDLIAKWMRTTEQGRAYAKRNTVRRRDIEGWVEDARDQVRRYTLDYEPSVVQAALKGKVEAAQLEKILPDPSQRPVVHGELLNQAFGKSAFDKLIDPMVTQGYKILGEIPSSVLSRQPFFDKMYRTQMQKTIDLHGGTITKDVMDRMADNARQYALRETRELLYDLSEQSQLEEMLRFFMPFYGAWGEVITRWAGLAVENPPFVARLRLAWRAPEKAGIVQDEDGNVIQADGTAVSPTGEKVEPGKQRNMVFQVPEWAREASVPFLGKPLETKETAKFNKASFNMILNGPPGWGPPIQIAANEIVKRMPEHEQDTLMKWFLPMGTSRDWVDMALPTSWRNYKQLAEGEDDPEFRSMFGQMYQDELIKYELGTRDTVPTMQEVMGKAGDMQRLKWLSGLVMPVTAQYASPYELHRQILRDLRERQGRDLYAFGRDEEGNPISADEYFLRGDGTPQNPGWGEEFFALTQSTSKSNNGIAPTINAYKLGQQRDDLIEKYPEYGALIVGQDEARGDFSDAVYDRQMNAKLRPGSSEKQRYVPSVEEGIENQQRGKGWREYSQFMDLLDAKRIARGAKTYNSKSVADLNAQKKLFTDKLREKYPAWAEDFMSTDTGQTEQNLRAFHEITSDPRLAQRKDIEPFKNYMLMRDIFVKKLRSAPYKTLDGNPQLKNAWDSYTLRLVKESSLAFGPTYYRWLSNDKLQAGDKTAEELKVK